MEFSVKEIGKYKYYEAGEGPTLVLLHGLFGALSNFKEVISEFQSTHKVIVPILPIYEMPLVSTGIGGLVKFFKKFVEMKKLSDMTLLGNSLGGHVALAYTLKYTEKVKAMILTGSSGLYENTLGGSFPKRGDYNFIKEKTELTFYDPKVASKDLVDEVYEIINNRDKVLRVIALSRSAMRNNLANDLCDLDLPVCLIWGKDDTITPANVADEFHALINDSELHFIDKCGHAAMMEKPIEFNVLLASFLNKLSYEG